MVLSSLKPEVETLEHHSFECTKSVALGSVSNSYSSISLKCVLFHVDCNATTFLLSFLKEPSYEVCVAGLVVWPTPSSS